MALSILNPFLPFKANESFVENYCNAGSVIKKNNSKYLDNASSIQRNINVLDYIKLFIVEVDNIKRGKILLGHKPNNIQLRVNVGGRIAYTAAKPYYPEGSRSTTTILPNTPSMIAYFFNDKLEFSMNARYESADHQNLKEGFTSFNWIGRRSGYHAEHFKGYIAEIIVTDVLPSAEVRQKIEGYLAHKWNLDKAFPETHPYKKANPLK